MTSAPINPTKAEAIARLIAIGRAWLVRLRRFAGRQKQKLIFRVINPLRYLKDLAHLRWFAAAHGASSRQPVRVILLSDRGAFCSEQQFHPFAAYRSELKKKLNLVSLHLDLNDAFQPLPLILPHFDLIGLKLSYLTPKADALRIANKVRAAAATRRVVYFDGDDDLGIQWPEMLSSVDLYVKKHALLQRSDYRKTFAGKSNLHDYVHHRYGHSFSKRDYGHDDYPRIVIHETPPVDAEQIGKITIGCNLATDRLIMKLYEATEKMPSAKERPNDIIFRGNVPKDVWISHLRKDVGPILTRLGGRYRVVTPTDRVTLDQYYDEMKSTKICVSPFGYGEICWRDFEAVLCGCLLVKPAMDHVETYPNIFRRYQTYVPVAWDFSDLEEKCEFYLSHEVERQRIISHAFEVLDDFYRQDGFLRSVAYMLGRLNGLEVEKAEARADENRKKGPRSVKFQNADCIDTI